MEQKIKFSHSVKVLIRNKKAQIRRQFWDIKKQDEEIAELYKRISHKEAEPTKVVKTVKAPAKQVKEKK